MKNTKNTKKTTIKKIVFTALALVLSFTFLKASILDNVMLVRKITYCKLMTPNVRETTIPFTIEHGRIVVEVAVQSGKGKAKKQRLVMDTGAPLSFTDEFAETEHVQVDAVDMKTVAYGGKESTTTSYITKDPVTLSIGAMQIVQPHVNIQPIKVAELKCDGAAGLLGSNVLSKFIVTINFGNNTITLSQKKNFDYTQVKGNIKKIGFMPLFMQKNPYIQVTYNGNDFSGVLDTGDPGLLMLQYKGDIPASVLASFNDTAYAKSYETFANIVNINGVVKEKGQAYTVRQSRVTIDNDTLPAASISVMPQQHGTSMSMGLNFLRQYDRVIIDWGKNDLYFIDPVSRPSQQSSDIMLRHMADEKKFVVGVIDIHSPFYKKGLRAGDEVNSIDGQKLADIICQSECDLTDKIKQLCKTASAVEINKDTQLVTISK